MITLTAEEAGSALGMPPLAALVSGVSIDSRSTRLGDLFVALRGERFDGHDFVESALAAGAAGAVVETRAWAARRGEIGSQVTGTEGWSIYEVGDTLEALGALAREVRRKSGVTVLAITGSVGKTGTKDLLGAMVAKVRRVVTTAANQNNEVGVPLTLLAIQPDTEVAIVEMGMRGSGQIAALARAAEPDVGVITNVHPVHLELLGTLDCIAKAKGELIAGLRPGGVAVVPCDCGPLQPHVATATRRVVTFGFGPGAERADVHGWLEVTRREIGHVLSLRWPEGRVEIATSLASRHSLENAVAATAACYAAGLPVSECVAGIRDVQFTRGRGDVLRLPGLCIIDDTYNANPAAVRVALESLVRMAAELGGRPVAVLGDMLELGEQSERYHREAGIHAAETGVRALWGVGPLSRATVEGFRDAWEACPETATVWMAGHVGSAEETSSVVAGLRSGDVVLFKASRSMKLEVMVSRVVGRAEAGTWTSRPDPAIGTFNGPQESQS
jgi:UDP-N-acetylmuramoyl-tripeptide--D-alanyl-D-alanine ligase